MTALPSLPALGLHATGFLHWWREELRGLLPRRLRRRPRSVLRLDGQTASIAKPSRSGLQDIVTFAVRDLAGQGRALRALAAQREIVLLVPSSWILRRVLQLPAAAEPRLAAVLGFELEQHLPFPAEEMVWSTRLLRRLPEAQRIEVEVAVLPRAVVAPLAAQLRRVAGTAHLVARADLDAEWPEVPVDLLAPPRTRWRRRIELGLALAALLLGLQLGQAELRRQEEAVAAVEARAARARDAAERVLALESETAGLRARLAAATELRGARPPAVAILEELAQRLPDDVWLTELRLSEDQLLLSGFAVRSDRLLEMLDGAGNFHQARFTAPVTRGARDPADRFQIALRVAPAGKPQQASAHVARP
ncbi:PilN domain-containing protein [Roseomonas marmotae]|uniref:PilN domain-containing protein n=1 Tax=Roseomonas marmotae TaxID=2768161 RepID=A0ABS3KC11_9PROT|nr:PilN domain-containing protein [Roseomonas marmotae]MBO1075011.1 PilN domain-containing protein [Roseomonas marmotae]QTI79953.1 PilN domain-containing protein [Roseomonas marmotae]